MAIIQPLQYVHVCMHTVSILFEPLYISSHTKTHTSILPPPHFSLPTDPPFPTSAGLNDLLCHSKEPEYRDKLQPRAGEEYKTKELCSRVH